MGKVRLTVFPTARTALGFPLRTSKMAYNRQFCQLTLFPAAGTELGL
jgi:hypothetical protein